MTSVEVFRSWTGLAFRDEGIDPPIRPLGRVCACFPGVNWSAAARRNFSVFVAAGRIADVVSSKGLEGAAAVVRTEGRDED